MQMEVRWWVRQNSKHTNKKSEHLVLIDCIHIGATKKPAGIAKLLGQLRNVSVVTGLKSISSITLLTKMYTVDLLETNVNANFSAIFLFLALRTWSAFANIHVTNITQIQRNVKEQDVNARSLHQFMPVLAVQDLIPMRLFLKEGKKEKRRVDLWILSGCRMITWQQVWVD